VRGVVIGCRYYARDVERGIQSNGLHQFESVRHVVGTVKWRRRVRSLVPESAAAQMLLQVRSVTQHDVCQRLCRGSAVDGPAEPVLYDFRQVADVVDVSVRHDDCGNVFGIDRERHVVEGRYVGGTLKQTAVDKNVLAGGRYKMLASCNGAGRADKGKFSHGSPARSSVV
jgi:hypothetical protein